MLEYKMAKRRGRKGSSASMLRKKGFVASSSKVSKVLKNLFVFLALFVVSLVLYKVTTNAFWNDLFFLIMLVAGFVTLAFLIVWLVLLWLKAIGK